MFPLAKLTVLASTLSSALAAVVPRAGPPPAWNTPLLEPYDTYHARYLALSCHTKHDSPFFAQCCHPLLREEKPSSRLAACFPTSPGIETDQGPSVPAEGGSQPEEECDNEADEDDYENEGARATRSVTDDPEGESKSTLDPSTAPVDSAMAETERPSYVSASAKSAAVKVYEGGFATYYYQHGVAGACGKVHSDSDMIAAIDGHRYGNLNAISHECGKRVKITNLENKKTVTVMIADACPTCTNSNSIDLSEAAFMKIADLERGIVKISWSYV